jgi:hypothetical protein
MSTSDRLKRPNRPRPEWRDILASPRSQPIHPDDVAWQPIEFSPAPQGKICYFLCSASSTLPVRDVLGQQGRGSQREPHYETQTFNFYAAASQRHVRAAIKAGCRYLFFATRYKGKLPGYRDRYLLAGYYALEGWAEIEGRWAVRASRAKFVAAQDAFIVTPETCQQWGTTYGHLRYLLLRLGGPQLEHLLNDLEAKPDATANYVQETGRLVDLLQSQRSFAHAPS